MPIVANVPAMRRLVLVPLILAALALGACNREGPVIPTQEAASGQQGSNANQPFTVSADAGQVGSALARDQSIATPQTEFAPGDTVYISVPGKNKPNGSSIEVFWFHQDGKSRKEEGKRLEGAHVAFEFVPQEVGRYSVEIDVNGRPIGLTDFTVQ